MIGYVHALGEPIDHPERTETQPFDTGGNLFFCRIYNRALEKLVDALYFGPDPKSKTY